MKLYSDEYCDEVIINKQHYDEFCQKVSEATNYEETKVNDLIYFAYEMFEEMEYSITKRRLLLKIVDLVDVIRIDELIGLKHFELKRLLKAEKDNYLLIFNELPIGDNNQLEKNDSQ